MNITENEFKDKISNGKVLVDCFAEWCGPCKMLSPIIDEVSKEVVNCQVYKLDVDNAPNISKEYGIMSIPTLLLFENGNLIKQQVGFISKEDLIDFIG